MFFRAAVMAVAASALLAVGGCALFGSNTSNTSTNSSADIGPEETGGIGVNAYLWRASLDTLDFLPLASADPFGGVIITDWYTNPQKTDERLKATVYILDTRLRADGLKVTVNKQVAGPAGGWVDAATAAQTEIDLQNAILTRARQLRLSAAGERG